MTDQETCEQRIEKHLASRVETIRLLLDAAQSTREDYSWSEIAELGDLDATEDGVIEPEKAQERLWELPLSIERLVTVDVMLSTGGPADGFRITFKDGEAWRGEYWFQDWFDGATRPIDSELLDDLVSAWSLDSMLEVSQDA